VATGGASSRRTPAETDPDPEGPAAFAASPFAEFADVTAEEVASIAPAGEAERPTEPPAPDPAPVRTEPADDAGEIDRVLLAKEFSGLLQLDADDDEARS
jgi:hypothetical protein